MNIQKRCFSGEVQKSHDAFLFCLFLKKRQKRKTIFLFKKTKEKTKNKGNSKNSIEFFFQK
jgi:hypothetical protein